MGTAWVDELEYYIPDELDMALIHEHPMDCDCVGCLQAKNSRNGGYYNGIQWVEIV